MKSIELHDKSFELYIDKNKIAGRVKELATQITNSIKSDKPPVFIVVLNGAFMFAADLLKQMDINADISFVKLASYSGTSSSGKVKKIIGLNEDIEGRTVVIIEDIVDTGITMEMVLKELSVFCPEKIYIATLLYKPAAFTKNFAVHFVGFEIPTDFVVGYGLDYNGFGRNLPDIYVLK
ncbi:MAG: hypoxanthine phosphoribosyltransferase [Bacteroidales bacterium]|nr:hypoxanthine phosphoribosyltransferase [Bacteroidales bacterium]